MLSLGFFNLFSKLSFQSLDNTSRKNSYTHFFLLRLSGCRGEAQGCWLRRALDYAVEYFSSQMKLNWK